VVGEAEAVFWMLAANSVVAATMVTSLFTSGLPSV
jgi:hypothetical protein